MLVVEDAASVGGLVAALIRQEGYRAVRAWDAQEAIRLARGRRPDLVLLDLGLQYPEVPPVIQDLVKNEATGRSPMVLVTAHEVALDAEQREAIVESVAKPFDIDVMLNAVRKGLGEPLIAIEPRQYDAQDHFLHGY